MILFETLTIVQERKGKMESVDAALLSMGLLHCSIRQFLLTFSGRRSMPVTALHCSERLFQRRKPAW